MLVCLRILLSLVVEKFFLVRILSLVCSSMLCVVMRLLCCLGGWLWWCGGLVCVFMVE